MTCREHDVHICESCVRTDVQEYHERERHGGQSVEWVRYLPSLGERANAAANDDESYRGSDSRDGQVVDGEAQKEDAPPPYRG